MEKNYKKNKHTNKLHILYKNARKTNVKKWVTTKKNR
jgi:hypothetical protein